MTTDILGTYYNTDHWSRLTFNQRPWYVPELLAVWRSRSIFRPFVPISVDLSRVRARNMIFRLMFDPEPNINPLDWRAKWIDHMNVGAAEVEITTEHHGGKIILDKSDELITYWQENGRSGLAAIIRSRLAPAATVHLDRLARNAFLKLPFASYAMGAASDFAGLDSGNVNHRFTLDWVMDVQLRAMTLNLPGFDGSLGSIVCITSPAAIYEISKDPDWIDLNRYTETGRQRLFTGEVGSFKGCRFVATNDAILWNCGAIGKQVAITSPAKAGDGGSNWANYKMDTTYNSPYIQCADFAATDFKVDDVVTIHTARTGAFGVTNGVDWRDGKTVSRIVKYVDHTNNRLGFDRPLLFDYDTDLNPPNGVYGYVTKGTHVHSAIFIAAPGAVVAGVTMPLTFHVPPPIDDTMSVYRFVYETYTGYQTFRPEFAEVVFYTGAHRISGSPVY